MEDQKIEIKNKMNNKMIVKPKNLNVMKRNLFKLMMLVGLIALANTTYALNEKTVIAGGKYSYELTGIKVNTAASSSLTFSYGGAGETLDNSLLAGAVFTSGSALPNTIVATLTFDITYATTGDTGGDITVTVVDGGNGCSNSILLTITVQPAPTVDLAIADVADGCQDTGAAADKADAVSASTGNTLGYATTITMTNIPADYSGTATITLSGTGTASLTSIAMVLAAPVTGFTYTDGGSGIAGTLTWDESAAFSSGDEALTFNVTFTTTEGTADLGLTITASAVSVTENGGGTLYPESGAGLNTQSTSVWAMPSIGSWTGL